jgi:hypothetical protein
MAVYRIRLDAHLHAAFLAEKRKDPITKEPLSAGMEIVICANDQIAFVADNWTGACPICHCADTLPKVPTNKLPQRLGGIRPEAPPLIPSQARPTNADSEQEQLGIEQTEAQRRRNENEPGQREQAKTERHLVMRIGLFAAIAAMLVFFIFLGIINSSSGTQVGSTLNTLPLISLPPATSSEVSTMVSFSTLTLPISIDSTSTPSITASQSLSLSPAMSGFNACLKLCTGYNSLRTFPEKTTKIYIQWHYENIPSNAHYVRIWTQASREWVRYDCLWPNPSSGEENITLTEPDGLYSGEWTVTVYIDDKILLQENLTIQGNWKYWDPAGYFNSCYGKK